MRKTKDYIKVEDCVHGGLYRLECRNFTYGVYDERNRSFIGIRTKFKFVFLFPEYHWDTSSDFGTAKPMELIEISDLEYSEVSEHVYEEVTDEMIKGGEIPPSIKVGTVVPMENKKLRDYLNRKIKELKGR